MADIVTLTINPSIDTSTSVNRVAPVHKLRCAPPHRDPGGGGVNVARVAVRFGADVKALCAAGGVMGELLRRLIDCEGIPSLIIEVSEETVFGAARRQAFRDRLRSAPWSAARSNHARRRLLRDKSSFPHGRCGRRRNSSLSAVDERRRKLLRAARLLSRLRRPFRSCGMTGISRMIRLETGCGRQGNSLRETRESPSVFRG